MQQSALILCFAPEDEGSAGTLAAFLGANLPVKVSCTEAVVGPGFGLMQAAERALSGDIALVLLSPASVPEVWNRVVWEPLFMEKPEELGTRLGFVLVRDCRFPALLRRKVFFDARADALQAARAIKCWLLRPEAGEAPLVKPDPVEADVAAMRITLADAPGVAEDVEAELAVRFAEQCAEDFETVYRIDCGERSRAGIVGDVGSAVGLPMSGTAEQNRATLADWATKHRTLLLLAGVCDEDREFVNWGGLASVILTSGDFVVSRTAQAVRRFQRLAEGEEKLAAGSMAAGLLKGQQRYTEMLEVLEAMATVARDGGDAQAVRDVEWQLYWTRHDLGMEGEEMPTGAGVENEDFQFRLPGF